MGGPPPGARISDDGKWWWDGSRWVAMPAGQLVAQPAPQPAQSVPMTSGGQVMAYPVQRTNSLAVASLVAGIAAWVICPLLGAILAIVFGHIARGQIKTSGEQGNGLALAGLILGYAHIALSIIGVILLVVVFGSLAAFLSTLPLPTPSP
jgi:Domain of unknown function (DUF4190)